VRRREAFADEAACLQYLIAVVTSSGAMRATPLASAGFIGIAGRGRKPVAQHRVGGLRVGRTRSHRDERCRHRDADRNFKKLLRHHRTIS